MDDLKTTITGVVTAVVALAAHFNVVIPDTWQTFVVAAGILIVGFFAKDASKTS